MNMVVDDQQHIKTGWWLTYPLKNMSSSVGMIKFPTEWKNKMHVPKHQPEKGGLL